MKDLRTHDADLRRSPPARPPRHRAVIAVFLFFVFAIMGFVFLVAMMD